MEDITAFVEMGSTDGETMYIRKCVCGNISDNYVIDIYKEGTPCPSCGRKLRFDTVLRTITTVQEV